MYVCMYVHGSFKNLTHKIEIACQLKHFLTWDQCYDYCENYISLPPKNIGGTKNTKISHYFRRKGLNCKKSWSWQQPTPVFLLNIFHPSICRRFQNSVRLASMSLLYLNPILKDRESQLVNWFLWKHCVAKFWVCLSTFSRFGTI
jgi:hypothetical protein